MGFAFVRYYATDGNDLTKAAEHGERLIGSAQEYFGVSSRRYIEIIELMAKIRLAQSRHDDAIALLQKSMRLRAELLGADHPSIASVSGQIDEIRHATLDAAEPIWETTEIEDTDIADRYAD